MAEISAQLVKELRDRTSVGFMECKKALQETNGDVDAAEVVLRKRGVSVAAKKAGREANEGLIEAYIHPGSKLGVLLELNCESDFVARTEDFQGLARDIAMHVAATSPRFVRREEVDEAAIAQEKEIQRARALKEGKPEQIVDKIVEGRMGKFYEEVVLLEQPFVKDNSKSVQDLITDMIAKLGENITVGRVARFKIGEES
jgi:elongation factor Ts